MAWRIAKCSGCGAAGRVDALAERGTALFEFMYPPITIKGKRPEWAACWACGGTFTFASVKAKLVTSIVCDHRCTRARGASCTCSCGGENHGRAL